MAVVWGMKQTGTTGAMTEADIVAFLLEKSGWQLTPQIQKAFTNAANYMMNHKGKDGGTIYHFDGKMIFHVTEGHGEATIFFTSDKSSGIASIVGIGEHSGAGNKTATYTLKWKTNRWNPGHTVLTKDDQGKTVKKHVPSKQISL